MVTSLHKKPSTRGHEFTILLYPSLVIITIHLVCLNHALGKEEDFSRNTSILNFLPQNDLPFGWGHEIYNLLSPYPTNATYQI